MIFTKAQVNKHFQDFHYITNFNVGYYIIGYEFFNTLNLAFQLDNMNIV
jgi:hypothetical protein